MLKYASISKNGKRKYNEDYLKISAVSNRDCFVVCDGLGGHDRGDLAAKIAGNTFIDEFYYNENIQQFLFDAFIKAQRKIEMYKEQSNDKSDMKTTAVCMVTDEVNLFVGHVGDSRFYGFKKDGSFIRSLDHSIPQLLVQSNTIKEEEIRNHPNRNMLLRAIGDKWDEPLCELSNPMQLNEFEAFLLCTDGFWELINEEQMIFALHSSNSPQEWLDKMTDVVEVAGAEKEMDNYTAITVFVQ